VTKNALTAAALLGSTVPTAVTLHDALGRLVIAVGAGGAFGFAIGHLLAVLLGIHDQYADRMARVWTAACAAIALAYWIMYVITGWKGP
jgi:NhaP-type Na+/H+ or K+/H+ antiporter